MSDVKPMKSDFIATTKASQHGTREPKFLFYPFLPYKKLILLQGESGIGNGLIKFISGEEAADNTMDIPVSKKEIAVDMITSLLSDGAKQSTEVIETIKSAGISESTINAAKREAFVESKKIGDGWLWQLPLQDVNITESNTLIYH